MMPPYEREVPARRQLAGRERTESGEARLAQRDLSADADEHGDRKEDRRQSETLGEVADPQSRQHEHDGEAHRGHEDRGTGAG